MRRMSRAGTAAAACVAVGLLAGCMSTSPQASSAQTPTLRSTAPASTATSTSGDLSMPSLIPIAPPTVYSGSGSAVVSITKPAGATVVVATITGNQAGKHFDVRALDGCNFQLVATTAPYSGSTVLDPLGTNTTQLRVHSVGPWTITLSDARSAPVFTAGYSGSGDAVLLDRGRGRVATLNITGSGPFRLKMYGAGRTYRPITETGPWNGTVPWPDGVALVAVQASGAWSIVLSQF